MSTLRLYLVAGLGILTVLSLALAGDRALLSMQPGAADVAVHMQWARRGVAVAAGCLLLAAGLVLWHLRRQRQSLDATQDDLVSRLHEQELVLMSHYRDLSAQLARSRDTLAADMGELDTSNQFVRGSLEMRFASMEASIKHVDDTLNERLEGLASLVSNTLQASDSKWMSDRTMNDDVLDGRLHRIDRLIAQRLDDIDERLRVGEATVAMRLDELVGRQPSGAAVTRSDAGPAAAGGADGFDRLEARLERIELRARDDSARLGHRLGELDQQLGSSHTAVGVQALTIDALQASLDALLHRVEAIDGWLRGSGERLGTQFGELGDRLPVAQSVNNSNFGDFTTQPMPLTGTHGAQLQSVLLNLSDLQLDLRAQRNALRKRLRDLPSAS
jgi:tetrahydromethanopterin S-methyltransferase subunit G